VAFGLSIYEIQVFVPVNIITGVRDNAARSGLHILTVSTPLHGDTSK